MSPYYRRKKAGRRENTGAALAALGAAAGVAALTFYFVRLVLTREPLSSGPATPLPGSPEKALLRGESDPAGQGEAKE